MRTLVAFLLMTSAAFAGPQDDKRIALAGVQFLDRTQLTGNEAQAMMQVRALLGAIANGQITLVVPKPEKGGAK